MRWSACGVSVHVTSAPVSGQVSVPGLGSLAVVVSSTGKKYVALEIKDQHLAFSIIFGVPRLLSEEEYATFEKLVDAFNRKRSHPKIRQLKDIAPGAVVRLPGVWKEHSPKVCVSDRMLYDSVVVFNINASSPSQKAYSGFVQCVPQKITIETKIPVNLGRPVTLNDEKSIPPGTILLSSATYMMYLATKERVRVARGEPRVRFLSLSSGHFQTSDCLKGQVYKLVLNFEDETT